MSARRARMRAITAPKSTAAVVQAIATEQRALNERNARAEACGANGGDEPRGAAANHHEVVVVAGRHGPRSRSYVVQQTPVVLVEWREVHRKVRIIIMSFARYGLSDAQNSHH